MNRESIDCRKVAFGCMERPGDFCIADDKKTLYVWLPGVPGPDALQIQHGAPGGDRVWGFDGNMEKPTLFPSIHTPGYWHGYLRKGRLESC